MKLKILLLSFLAVFLMSGSAFATIVVDGDYTDWFATTEGFNTGSDGQAYETNGQMPQSGFTDGIYWAEEDYVSLSGRVWPGWGWQAFDHEGLYFTQNEDNWYIGLMTGMQPGVTIYNEHNYNIGDIALDLGMDSTWTSNLGPNASKFGMALDMSSVRLYNGSDLSDLDNQVQLINVSSWSNPGPFIYQSPYDATPSLTGASIQFSVYGSGNSYFYEFGINKDDLDLPDGLRIFVTMSCGNDWNQLDVASIPEPSTMLLFGTGLLGLAAIGRKKLFKK